MGGGPMDGARSVIYCVVPRHLAKLHEPLKRHFANEAGVEVVVDTRLLERRSARNRRTGGEQVESDRRRVLGDAGRRVADRRGPTLDAASPPLPYRARRHASELAFVTRVEPSSQHLEDIDTARVVARIQAGESELFSELYLRYFDRVYSYVRVALRDEHQAEDLTQQVFLNVIQALPRYERRPGRPFRAWLFVIVRNQTLTELKRTHRLEPVDPGEISRRSEIEVGNEEVEVLNWISDRELVLFIERLPLPQRQALHLRYMLGLSNAQIAEVLGRSEVDVRTLQFRALRFLRARLIAVGRKPESRERARVRRFVKQAPVLRWRRFALTP